MKQLLVVIAVLTALFVVTMVAIAQICPATPQGYSRQYRPQDVTPNYPPPSEPGCYMSYTMSQPTLISCYLCHSAMQRRLA